MEDDTLSVSLRSALVLVPHL
uniref:Uncharacterized protein n=1 Tax=Arundo donax TaxID=35708 RepID=A0A0A9FGF7_ARUDO